MRVAFFLATFFAASVSVFASAASVVSPNHPQTFAYGEMIWHQLYLERAGGELAARITFSNLPYASSDEPRRDEKDSAAKKYRTPTRRRQLLRDSSLQPVRKSIGWTGKTMTNGLKEVTSDEWK